MPRLPVAPARPSPEPFVAGPHFIEGDNRCADIFRVDMKGRDFFTIDFPYFSHLEILYSPTHPLNVVHQGNHHIAAVTTTTFQQPGCCCPLFFWANHFQKGLTNGHYTIAQTKFTNARIIVVGLKSKNVKNLLAHRGQFASNQGYLFQFHNLPFRETRSKLVRTMARLKARFY